MEQIKYFTALPPEERPSPDTVTYFLSLLTKNQSALTEIHGETGIEGLKIDFCCGLRLQIPPGNWQVTVRDGETGTLVFNETVSAVRLESLEKYYLPWVVEIKRDGIPVFRHVFEPTGQEVAAYFLHRAMGDVLAILPYVRAFKEKHRANIKLILPEYLREMATRLYPDLPQGESISSDAYAVFYLGAWRTKLASPADSRLYPLGEYGGTMLGILRRAPWPRFYSQQPRPVPEKYVCIAVQASTLYKSWHCPGGWEAVVDYLKGRGYRVFCIDRHYYQEENGLKAYCPHNAEDFTGDKSIMERAEMLYHAAFFLGVSSGLAWIAHSVGCPVVIISGISEPWYEFYTPYRVINQRVCHGCLNDAQNAFNASSCPRHGGTPRELECSKNITVSMVLSAVEELIQDLPKGGQ